MLSTCVRYGIYQYNIDDLILCSLPHHDTESFVRIVQMVSLTSESSKWHWLEACAVSSFSLLPSCTCQIFCLRSWICIFCWFHVGCFELCFTFIDCYLLSDTFSFSLWQTLQVWTILQLSAFSNHLQNPLLTCNKRFNVKLVAYTSRVESMYVKQ